MKEIFKFANVLTIFIIVLTLASVVGSGYLTYDNAKSAKKQAFVNSMRIQAVETKQARFEGMIDERTKNTAMRVNDIYDIVKDWTPK